jgi:hypothetical protein
MNKLASLFSVFLLFILCAGLAAAQQRSDGAISLSDLPGDEKFTSAEADFSINLPRSPSETLPVTDKLQKGFEYTWKLREGIFAVKYGEFTNGLKFNTDQLYKEFFDGFKSGIFETPEMKMLSEEPYRLGDLRGFQYAVETYSVKGRVRVMAYGNKYYALTSIPFPGVPNSDALMQKALDSFSVTPAKK